MKKTLSGVILIVVCALFVPSSGWAAEVTIPNLFTPNTPAKADSVNENFSAVELAVDDNAAMITSLQNAHSNTRTGYVSVGAGAFTAFDETYAFNRFSGISIKPGNNTSTRYIAGVSLPHGSVVTSFSAQFIDNDATNTGTAQLREFCGNFEDIMADVTTTIDSAISQWYTDPSITGAGVDNTDCTYNIQLYLLTTGISFYKAVIEYEYSLD